MNEHTFKIGPKILKKLQHAFSGLSRCRLLKLRDAYRLVNDSVRVPYEGFPMELMLGDNGKRLRLYPEYPLQTDEKPSTPPSFVLEDPEHGEAELYGFLRIEPGEELTLGRYDPHQQALFNYPDGVKQRHLRLIHDGDALIFKDKTNVGTCISPMMNVEKKHRLSSLLRLAGIFGVPLQPLPEAEALELIQNVNALMKNEARRPLDDRGLPGGLLELPAGITPIIVADLHAQIDNLLVILSHNEFLNAIENGKACLVVLGDAVHSERDGELQDMEDSMLMMDLIFRLKLRFPKHFFFLRGNHESFSEDISKAGVSQGLLWKRALRKTRGKEYRKAMQQYYDMLPYVVVSPDFFAAHAAAPRNKVTRKMLINVHRHPNLRLELINNRMQRANRPGGYSKGDVRRFRKALDLPADLPFIVGHTPMDQKETYWLNVGGVENHHVLYSANEKWVGLFTRIGHRVWPIRYPCEPLRDLVEKFDGGPDRT